MDVRQVLQPNVILDDKYRVDRVIGVGGFGVTYEAFDVGLAASVAVKEYYPARHAFRDATSILRPLSETDRPLFDRLRHSFVREARTLAKFDHPAIVRVLSVFEANGTAYMAMKFENGPSLKSWLSTLGRFPTQEELDRITAPLLGALSVLHSAQFLHRDIAPDNIILRPDGSAVLIDFGASRRVMAEASIALTGIIKKGFSPQEQYATNSRGQGPWTDIYALGATLYQAVTGQEPPEATERVLDDNAYVASQVAAGRYRRDFLAAIDRAIRVRPSERPQDVRQWYGELFAGTPLAAEFERFYSGLRTSSSSQNEADPFPAPAPVNKPRSGPPQQQERSRPYGPPQSRTGVTLSTPNRAPVAIAASNLSETNGSRAPEQANVGQGPGSIAPQPSGIGGRRGKSMALLAGGLVAGLVVFAALPKNVPTSAPARLQQSIAGLPQRSEPAQPRTQGTAAIAPAPGGFDTTTKVRKAEPDQATEKSVAQPKSGAHLPRGGELSPQQRLRPKADNEPAVVGEGSRPNRSESSPRRPSIRSANNPEPSQVEATGSTRRQTVSVPRFSPPTF